MFTDAAKVRAARIWLEGLSRFPDSTILKIDLAGLYYNRAIEGLSSNRWQDIQQAMTLLRQAEAEPDRSRMEEWLLRVVKALVLASATGDIEGAAAEARAAKAMVPDLPPGSSLAVM